MLTQTISSVSRSHLKFNSRFMFVTLTFKKWMDRIFNVEAKIWNFMMWSSRVVGVGRGMVGRPTTPPIRQAHLLVQIHNWNTNSYFKSYIKSLLNLTNQYSSGHYHRILLINIGLAIITSDWNGLGLKKVAIT